MFVVALCIDGELEQKVFSTEDKTEALTELLQDMDMLNLFSKYYENINENYVEEFLDAFADVQFSIVSIDD